MSSTTGATALVRHRDLPGPATAPPEHKDTLRAELIDTVELRMRRDLWRPGDATLLRALGDARRVLAVCDRPERRRRLDTWLGYWRERGVLDHYRTVDAADLVGPGEADPVRAVLRAAVATGLGRRDAFVSLAGPSATAATALAAAVYRRYVRAVRLHDDLRSLLDSLGRTARVLAGVPVCAAEARDSVLLVDVDTLLADPTPIRPDEASAIRHLARQDDVLAGQFDGHHDVPAGALDRAAHPAVVRQAALDAVARLLHRHGPDAPRIWPAPAVPAAPPASVWRPPASPASGPQPAAVPPSPSALSSWAASAVPAGAVAALSSGAVSAVSAGAVAAEGLGRSPASIRAHRIRRLDYQVTFTAGVLDPGNPALSGHLPAGARVLAVVDDFSPAVTAAVREALGRQGRLAGYTVLPVRSSPGGKTLDAAVLLLRQVRRLGLGPADRILAVGGGTVLDLVGYVAACHPGQTPYVRVPTTLVGLVDAGVGLKVGVDLDGRKNLLGAYHPPLACLCDAGFLATLPAAEFRCGLAEIVKIALVRDDRLFHLVEEHHAVLRDPAAAPVLDEVLRRAVAAMLVELEENPWERRLRRLADFGHEFGHVLEERSGYRLRHGEAVAVGMALSCRLGVAAGRLPAQVAERAETLLRRIGLPTYDGCCDADGLWRALRTDVLPHKGGRLHLAVPVGIGVGGFVDSIAELDRADLHRAWSALRRRAGTRAADQPAPGLSAADPQPCAPTAAAPTAAAPTAAAPTAAEPAWAWSGS
ncbi:iron-containing alcohol dehydrogenase [Micromonospora sp. WMMD1102]|uniref:3-dehydroquinate synthase family protein n=1 Tax=Micromonospora sp. WMMD1102 TaxID=3016105 RepID=UPI0024158312|nr:iron-containing alcohol dehydrogenase [Micromonospora sp. WMMD1102]MDG4790125.1 iron-containing alcohol dehydrogenase [Micromonospora sp. WMMD1102]